MRMASLGFLLWEQLWKVCFWFPQTFHTWIFLNKKDRQATGFCFWSSHHHFCCMMKLSLTASVQRWVTFGGRWCTITAQSPGLMPSYWLKLDQLRLTSVTGIIAAPAGEKHTWQHWCNLSLTWQLSIRWITLIQCCCWSFASTVWIWFLC